VEVLAAAQLLLVRHGETLWNTEGRMQGHLDSELTPRGLVQARALAARIREFRPVAMYTSDLGRAVQTAEAIAIACGLSPILDAKLRERHLGIFEGLTIAEAQDRHPETWQAYKAGGPEFVIPNGESARQRHQRTEAALVAHAERHIGSSVVLVGHGGTLNTAFRVCSRMPLEAPRTFPLPNASLSILEYRADGWRVIKWADVEHLGPDGSTQEGV
jgi:2,3-bisphosphoglycerate-dependent phosphoglycerate mutase